MAHVARDDVKPLVDQMIRLLQQPDRRSRWHHLMRWMDWDLDLERQSEEIQHLLPRIQQALYLLERSRGASSY